MSLNDLAIRGQIAAWDLSERISAHLNRSMEAKRKGEVAFEYIIILVLMVAFIVAAFLILRPVIVSKAQEIANFVGGVNIEKGTVPGMRK